MSAAPARRRPSRLSLGPLVAVMFFTVSGGPFGLEGLVGSVGPGVAVLLLLLTPLLYSVPGHRWVDARRYDRLPSLPNPVATDRIFKVMPIPTDECSARGLPANCTPLTP